MFSLLSLSLSKQSWWQVQCFTSRSIAATMSTAPATSKARSALDEMGKKGEFKRVDSVYRKKVTEAPYKPESGRYHLYVSYACPWAHRTLIVRALKGLQEHIGVTVVLPTWQHTRPGEDGHAGWVFGDENSAVTPVSGHGSIQVGGASQDPIHKFKSVRDIYDLVGDQNGKYTVPVLFDRETNTIVNNESSDIIEQLNADFNHLAKSDAPDLNPEDTHKTQEELNEWIYHGINNGVYRSGFAQSQEAYNEAVGEVFESLDKVEAILSKQKYLTGDRLTLADIRLFVTLVRFDEVYVVYFKTNKKRIADYPNILNYVRDMYQMPGVADTVSMEHIKAHYYTSHPKLNAFSIVPIGPGAEAQFAEPHDRDRFNKN